MKNYGNIRAASHAWAHSREDGKASSLSFHGDTLYSYAEPIAKMMPNGNVIHTTRTWSNTTSKHQSLARQATSHCRAGYCQRVQDSPRENMDYARKRIAEKLQAALDAYVAKKDGTQTVASKNKQDKLRSEALGFADQANKYLAICKQNDLAEHDEPIDTANLEGIRAEMEAIEAAKIKAREASLVKEREEALVHLVQWRAGGYSNMGLRHLPCALRVISVDGVPTMIDTSRGAHIPVADALKLWPVVLQVRARGKSHQVRDHRLGHYSLNRIEADGAIVVGCHQISYAELELIARELGIFTEALA